MLAELAPSGIRVNAVSPGAPESHFNIHFRDIFCTEEQLAKSFDITGCSIPIGYCSTWRDIVPTIVFLASDRESFITGAIVPVDGGYINTCYCP